MNASSAAATNEQAVPSTPNGWAAPPSLASAPNRAPPPPPTPAAPGRLDDSLIADAVEIACNPSGRLARRDGWTPERIREFLRALAATGCVTKAARSAGMTRQAAYALRASTRGRAFALAWDGAVRIARGCLADDLLSRALNGNVETVWRDGAVFEQRHRHDNGLGLALLARLDRLADRADTANAAQYVAAEFDQFVEIAAAGGTGAADFVAARKKLGYTAHEELQVLRRAENFAATGDGLPDGHEAEESDAAKAIRALYAMATAEDEDAGEDEDELDEIELEPEQDAACPARSEADEEEDDDLSDLTFEEFERDILAGPFGEFVDDDDWDDEDVQVPEDFDVEAHVRLLARLIEAHGLGQDATRDEVEADAGPATDRSAPASEPGESDGT